MKHGVVITGAGAVVERGAPPRSGAGNPGERTVAAAVEDALAALPEAVRVRAARSERLSHLALAAAGPALATAGLLACEGPPRPRLGVVLGTAFGCFLTNAAYQRRLAEGGPPAASPRLFAATVSNAAAGEVAIAFRLGGPGVTLTAGAAAGLVALGHATDLLRAGHADALLAGGTDALGDALARWLGDGGLAVGRPVAEAAALLVLERAECARDRNAAVRAEVVGHAAGFEPDPEDARAGDGLAAAVSAALAQAEVGPGAVGLVVSAAPPAWAAVEDRALARALGTASPPRVVPKDVYGETLGAAGPLGLLAALAEGSAGSIALVLDVCASGHVAALVARCGEAR